MRKVVGKRKYDKQYNIDAESMGSEVKNNPELYRDGKYTRKGEKMLEGINTIKNIQNAGHHLNLDQTTGTYNVVGGDGEDINEINFEGTPVS